MFQPLPVLRDTDEEIANLLEELEKSRKVNSKPPPDSGESKNTEQTEPHESEKQETQQENNENHENADQNTQSEPNERPIELGKVTKIMCTVDTSTGPIDVASWKFGEYDYLKPYVYLPIQARGLFTYGGKIVARGYDKFFNVNEVPSSRLEVLQNLTGPFSVSTKENGCIILISGLEDGTLMVCSKHATGVMQRTGYLPEHCKQGNLAVYEQLKKVGRTPEELARALFNMNATAVLELCDDRFEEHILKYPPEMAGLYLHGLNFNMRKFTTYLMKKVAEFADEWGFRKVKNLVFDEFNVLWDFLENLKTKGLYEGREIEGFVIRGKKEGNDFFFKYKFEEPYYLFRQFRETTKRMIRIIKFLEKNPNQGPMSMAQIVRTITRHKGITLDYLDFCRKVFEEHPEWVDQYEANIGIVRMREMYLEYKQLGETDGMALLEYENDVALSERLNSLMKTSSTHYIIMPIACVAVGKTTILRTLSNLFPKWKHVQNDDQTKGRGFIDTVLQAACDHEVVLAEMNFHNALTRRNFLERIENRKNQFLSPTIALTFIAVNLVETNLPEKLKTIARERLLSRGDNHQSIKAGSEKSIALLVFEGFFNSLEPPHLKSLPDDWLNRNIPIVIKGENYARPDDEYAFVINPNTSGENSSLASAKTVVDVLRKECPDMEIKDVTDDEWLEAFEEAKNYTPKFQKKIKAHAGVRAEYYGIRMLHPRDLEDKIQSVLKSNRTWKQLVDDERIQDQFHVTLGHYSAAQQRSSSNEKKKTKDTEKDVCSQSPLTSDFKKVKLENEREAESQKGNSNIGSTNQFKDSTITEKSSKKSVQSEEMLDETVNRGGQRIVDAILIKTTNVSNLNQKNTSEDTHSETLVPTNITDGEKHTNEKKLIGKEGEKNTKLSSSETYNTNNSIELESISTDDKTNMEQLPSDLNKRRQKRTKRPVSKMKTTHRIPTNNKERWTELVRRYPLSRFDPKPDANKLIDFDEFCDIHVHKVVVIEKKLVVLRVTVSGPYMKEDDRWIKQNPELLPTNKYLHITMGTASPDIVPARSNTFLTALYDKYGDLPEGEHNVQNNPVSIFTVDFTIEKQPVFARTRRS